MKNLNVNFEANYREDSIASQVFQKLFESGRDIFSSSYEGNIPCTVEEFVYSIGAVHRFISMQISTNQHSYFVEYSNNSKSAILEIDNYKKHANGHFNGKIVINGDQDFIIQFDELRSKFVCPPSITWVVDTDGNTINLPVNIKPTFDSFYPFITRGLRSYIEAYIKSSSNILILYGEPGTGKTTFLKNLLQVAKSNAYVTYNPKVMASDSFFSDFLSSKKSDFLIFEDADLFLTSRKDGNDIMHMFLNVGDGLLSAPGKKIVFTTNLPSVAKIDPALVRKGRCFDVLKFRKLTKPEAEQVQKDCGLIDSLEDKKEFTLTEIFNGGNNSEVVTESNYGRIS
jgi:chromosomal replication initiation ATPase DnaA